MHQYHLAQHIPFSVPLAAAQLGQARQEISAWAQRQRAAAASLQLLEIARLEAELQSSQAAGIAQLRNAGMTSSSSSVSQRMVDDTSDSSSSASSSSASSSSSTASPAKTKSTTTKTPATTASGLDLLSLTATELPSLPIKKRLKRTTDQQDQQQGMIRTVSVDSAASMPETNFENTTQARRREDSTKKGNKKDDDDDDKKVFIDKVEDLDVLCGRGGRSNHHMGNKRYRQVVGDMKAMYRRTEAKSFKTDLSRTIVEHVCGYGGRFVKKDSKTGRYYVLSAVEARKKTSQALRETKQLKWTAS